MTRFGWHHVLSLTLLVWHGLPCFWHPAQSFAEEKEGTASAPISYEVQAIYPLPELGLVSDLRIANYQKTPLLFIADYSGNCIRRILLPDTSLNDHDTPVIETIVGLDDACQPMTDEQGHILSLTPDGFEKPGAICVQKPNSGEDFVLVATTSNPHRVLRIHLSSALAQPNRYTEVLDSNTVIADLACVHPDGMAYGADILFSKPRSHRVSILRWNESGRYELSDQYLGADDIGYSEVILPATQTPIQTPVALAGDFTQSSTPIWYIAEAGNGVIRRLRAFGEQMSSFVVVGNRDPSIWLDEGQAALLNLGRVWRLRAAYNLYYINGTDLTLRIVEADSGQASILIDLASVQPNASVTPSPGATRLLAFDISLNRNRLYALDNAGNLWLLTLSSEDTSR